MGSVADSVVANLANKKSIPNKFCKIYTNNNLTFIQFIPPAKIFFPMILQLPWNPILSGKMPPSPPRMLWNPVLRGKGVSFSARKRKM